MNLLGTGNSKTVKGEKKGWITYVMYLSPHKQNSKGKNLCPHASSGCAEACLFTAGRGRMKSIQEARINKTEFFLSDRRKFLLTLKEEITKVKKKHEKRNEKFCIRLNGTSDVPWENIIFTNSKNIFETFPDVQFYDYTKTVKRVLNNKYKNYHLTFSKSESNDDEVKQILKSNNNVAIVFNDLPSYYMERKVVNGDEDDLRFLDPQGVIVGLKAKGDAKNDTTGFVIK